LRHSYQLALAGSHACSNKQCNFTLACALALSFVTCNCGGNLKQTRL